MPKKTLKQRREELRDLIVQKGKDGIIVVQGLDGLMEMNLDEFIKQPAEGMLYDLNRDSATVLTFIDKPKWVNDYAVGLVIEKLKSVIETTSPDVTYDNSIDQMIADECWAMDILKELKEYPRIPLQDDIDVIVQVIQTARGRVKPKQPRSS